MNCKKGDLAIVIRPGLKSNNVGRVVECVTFFPAYQSSDMKAPLDSWGVRGRLVLPYTNEGHRWCNERGFDAVIDAGRLRPIRDNDGEDEMLRIAGKPREVETL
jgi:hypothetical protein